MKTYRILAAVLAGAMTVPQAVYARSGAPERGTAGVGLIVGNPTGASGKLWLSKNRALDVGFGFSGDFAAHADHLWHAWDALPQPTAGTLGVYAALGGRIEARRGDDEFGIRTMAGIDYLMDTYPWEFFAELGPVFRLTPGTSVSMDGGIGVRYLFGS